MHVTVSAPEPEILLEAQPGELFLIHAPVYGDCVAALLQTSVQNDTPNSRDVVVIGCRVGSDDAHHVPTGRHLRLHKDTPITRLDQIEPAPLRARRGVVVVDGLEELVTSLARIERLYARTPQFKSPEERRQERQGRQQTPLSEL